MNPKSIPHLDQPGDHRIPSEFGERLVTLCDGRPGLRSGLHIEVQEPSPLPSDGRGIKGEGQPSSGSSTPDTRPSATLDFIASDETLDRCDEIIVASGWRLSAYRRNPVFQNAHQYGDVIFTLGKAILTEVRLVGGKPALLQRVQFATEANPMARIAFGLYKGKFLNAVSVGFIPLRWENGETGKGSSVEGRKVSSVECRGDRTSVSSPSTHSPSTHDTRPLVSPFRRRYLEQELLEVSAVGIPANPNALQLGLKAGAIEKNDLKDVADLLRSVAASDGQQPSAPSLHHSITPFPPSNLAVSDTHTCALGVRGYEAQLLQLARDVLHVLRNT